MTPNCGPAEKFGRYLRGLRQRGYLTLERVEQMTFHHGHRIPKSQISRLETGKALPDLEALSILSAVYRVPASEMTERYDAEHRRRRLAVEVEGRSDVQLLAESKALIRGGYYERLLAVASAAEERLELYGPSDSAKDTTRRRRRLFWLYKIDALVHLGYYSLAKAECENLAREPDLSLQHEIAALQLYAASCIHMQAYLLSLAAIDLAEKRMVRRNVAPILPPAVMSLRGNLLANMGEYSEASQASSQALQLYEAIGDSLEACRERINLGWSLLQQGKLGVARRTLEAALEQARRSGYSRLRALALSNLAVLSFRIERHGLAERYALLSNETLREISYPEVYFRNNFYLREIARLRGDDIGIARHEAALTSLLDRMPRTLDEAQTFQSLLAERQQGHGA